MNSEEEDGLGMKNKAGSELYEEMYERIKEDLRKEMRLTKGSTDQHGEALDKKKYMKLVSEYKNFKKNNCRHFRFNSAANTTYFGKFPSNRILCVFQQ